MPKFKNCSVMMQLTRPITAHLSTTPSAHFDHHPPPTAHLTYDVEKLELFLFTKANGKQGKLRGNE